MQRRKKQADSAPYGSACTGCFKAKCRCVIRPGSDSCERCHRLKKLCVASFSVRRQAADQKQVSPGERPTRLEDRLANLVSLLQSRNVVDDEVHDHLRQLQLQLQKTNQGQYQCEEEHAGLSNPLGLNFAAASNGSPEMIPSSGDSNGHESVSEEGRDEEREEATKSSIELLHRLNKRQDGSANPLQPSNAAAAILLTTFRSQMLRYFPFIYLPPETTVEQLRHERPLLFQAIVCVASLKTRKDRACATQLKRELCNEAFLQNRLNNHPPTEQVIDLLLALLTFIAWGWEHAFNAHVMSRLLMVCVSLVGEMGSLASTPKDLRELFALWYADSSHSYLLTPHAELERHRAVLGCFVLSSMVSTYCQQADAMTWTWHLEEALARLDANSECPSDAALAALVRLQLLAVDAAHEYSRQHLHREQPIGQLAAAEYSEPAMWAREALQHTLAQFQQLEDLRSTISLLQPQFQSHILEHTYFVELCIVETVHTANSILTPLPSSMSVENSGGYNGPLNQSRFWRSIVPINTYSSAVLNLSSSDFADMSFVQVVPLPRCVAVMNNLTALQGSGWDHGAACPRVDLPILLDQMIARLEKSSESTMDLFAVLAQELHKLRSGIHGRVVHVSDFGGGTDDGSSLSGDQIGSADVVPEKGFFLNSRFWMDQFF